MRRALLFGLLFSLAAYASALTNISACSTLSTAGETYVLTADVNDSNASPCMNVTANNVTLDCNGRLVDGLDVSGSQAIFVNSLSGVTVKNCRFSDFGYIYVSNSTNFTFSDNSSFSNTHSLLLNNTSSSVIKDSNFSANSSWGLRIEGSSSGNVVSGNLFLDNGTISTAGLRMAGGSSTKVYDNYFRNEVNVLFTTVTSNDWNTVQTGAVNIAGGPFIGGNYWAKPSGAGFSQVCVDSDSDGFCDQGLDVQNGVPAVSGSNVDFLPLASPLSSLCNGNGSCDLPLEDTVNCAADCKDLNAACASDSECFSQACSCGLCRLSDCPAGSCCGANCPCTGLDACVSGSCVAPSCGDALCNGAETCSTCAGDCGACPAGGSSTAVPGYSGLEVLLTLAVLALYYSRSSKVE